MTVARTASPLSVRDFQRRHSRIFGKTTNRHQDGNGNYTPGEVNLSVGTNNPDFISITDWTKACGHQHGRLRPRLQNPHGGKLSGL